MSTVMIDPRVVTRGVAGKVSGAYCQAATAR